MESVQVQATVTDAELTLSDAEVKAAQLGPSSLKQAIGTFADRGTLLLRRAFPRELIQELGTAFQERYVSRGESGLRDSCLEVGGNRLMASVHIEPPFADPRVYGAVPVLQILNILFETDIVLNSFGAVCAFGGSPEQHRHRDHAQLFKSDTLCSHMPPHAVTVVIPLMDIDTECGTTALWETSHRKSAEERNSLPVTIPLPKMGDCYLMDYRLVHAGTPNRSDRPRTIMYLVYSRSWFRDAMNFGGQSPLIINRRDYDAIPKEYRPLFRFATPQPDSKVLS